MAGGERCQREEQGFTGGFLGFPGGKSEQDARCFGVATFPELIPGCWIQTLSCTQGNVGHGDCHGARQLLLPCGS